MNIIKVFSFQLTSISLFPLNVFPSRLMMVPTEIPFNWILGDVMNRHGMFEFAER